MSDSVGLAVIGCGDVATTRHLPAIAATTGVHLVACCDRDLSRADEFWTTGDWESTADTALISLRKVFPTSEGARP